MSPPVLEIEDTTDETSALPWYYPGSLHGDAEGVALTQPGASIFPSPIVIAAANRGRPWTSLLRGNVHAEGWRVAFRNLPSTLPTVPLGLERPPTTEGTTPSWRAWLYYGQGYFVLESMLFNKALDDIPQRQGVLQALPAQFYAAGIDAEKVHFDTSVDTDIIQSHQLKNEAINLIKELISAREPQEIERIEHQLYDHLSGYEAILLHIILDQANLINVRAMAARLYIAKVGIPTALLGPTTQGLLSHKSPLIRLGLVLGFADAHNWEMVRHFTEDPHPTVAEEARELLSEIMSEAHS